MQSLLTGPWRIVVTLITALFFNPPGLTGSAAWITTIIRTIVFIVLFRRNLAPFILSRISRHIRARSISLRSIRGLYVQRSGHVLKVERVGWGINPFSKSPISIKVEDLQLDITGRRNALPKDARGRRFKGLNILQQILHSLTILKDITAILLRACGLFFVILYIQALLSAGAIGIGQLFLRFLPSLVRDLEFEMDSIIVTSQALSGAGMAVEGLKFDIAVDMSQVQEIQDQPLSEEHHSSRSGDGKPQDLPRPRTKARAERFWERVWGQLQITVTLDVSVDGIRGFLGPGTLNIPSPKHTPHIMKMLGDEYGMKSKRNLFLRVWPGLQTSVSIQAIPRLQKTKPHSLKTMLKIPAVEIFADNLHTLLQLFYPAATLESPIVSPTHDVSSPLLSPSISPRSPFVNAISQFKRRYSVAALRRIPPPAPYKDPKYKAYVAILGSTDIELSSLKIFHYKPNSPIISLKPTYTFSVTNFHLHGGVSDPKSNELHRNWLGSAHVPEQDPPTYKVSCHSREVKLTFTQGSQLIDTTTVFLMAEPRINGLVHELPWITLSSAFTGDPNGPFVACDISISKLHFSESIDVLQSTIRHLTSSRGNVTAKQQPRPLSTFTPRLALRLLCTDICVRLKAISEDTCPALDIRTASFVADMHTRFSQISKVDTMTSTVQMDVDSTLTAQPIFVRVMTDQTLRSSESLEDITSLVVTDFIELSASAAVEGSMHDVGIVSMDRRPSSISIKCITDAFAIELWEEALISQMHEFSTRLKQGEVQELQSIAKPSPSPLNLSVHFSIPTFRIVVTGKDLNPACDLELSRGFLFQTAIAVQYRTGDTTHTVRRDISACASLGIPEDLPVEGASGNTPVKPSLVLLLSRILCNTAVATPYEYGPNNEFNAQDEAAILYVSRASISLYDVQRIAIVDKNIMGTHRASVHIPVVQGHFNLANMYSAILAIQTLKSILPPGKPPKKPKQSLVKVETSFSVGQLHMSCQFPLGQKLFIEVTSFSGNYIPEQTFQTSLKTLVAYVPNLKEGSWAELVRFRAILLTLCERVPQKGLRLDAEGLRVSIPHNFILSDLILDISLSVKAIKHFVRMAEFERYYPMPSPPPEDAKILPLNIEMSVGVVTFEAAEDPFEAKLGLIWRTGSHAQRIRNERDLAFEAKLRAVTAFTEGEEQGENALIPQADLPYHFTSKRTTSISDARDRLNMVHSMSWISTFSRQRDKVGQKEDTLFYQLHNEEEEAVSKKLLSLPFNVMSRDKIAPLVRVIFDHLQLSLSRPSFGNSHTGFLKDLGNMPELTEFSLLVPLHIAFTVDAATIRIRDYPLPMLNIPVNGGQKSFIFDTDLVVAEEMGLPESVQWIGCPILPEDSGIAGAGAFELKVPKTVMPVKSYASPQVQFTSPSIVEFTWGVSYIPAIQDIMRVVETLSSPPQDSSPSIGFWDKLRLVFHWRLKATFDGGAELHFKGSRDPYHISGEGAGFDFHWEGGVLLEAGYPNNENELIQLTSETMEVIVPDYDSNHGQDSDASSSIHDHSGGDVKKLCAKFTNGIRWGIGVVLERACGKSCRTCHGEPFDRNCRFFTFMPHYDVKLRCDKQSPADSYEGFRSNFIHFSTSLTSPLRPEKNKYSSFHLTPKVFAHFWSWWHLFDSALSLPIRQGKLFPESRPPTKKFGKHLATIKYRLLFSSVYIAHVYPLDTGDAWSSGETHCVGVKAFLEEFQADMHQREEEWSILNRQTNEYKKVKHKPFGAVDVVICGIDLRALFAVFLDPGKQSFPLQDSFPRSRKFWEDLKPIPLSSEWIDTEDFVELDWMPLDNEPNVYMHNAVHCPRFVYFKRTPRPGVQKSDDMTPHTRSKFGEEETHMCLMGKEPTVHEVQLDFAVSRLKELQAKLNIKKASKKSDAGLSIVTGVIPNDPPHTDPQTANTIQMITILQRYIEHLTRLNTSLLSASEGKVPNPSRDLYDMPVDVAMPEELGSFANVYQVHCPKIHLDNATRDILQQYYHASRARRGFEYHMSTRAVKFIRDQATGLQLEDTRENTIKRRTRAAQAVRRIISGEDKTKGETSLRSTKDRTSLSETDPLYGWDQGVTETRSHLCLLLKPQIVLRSEKNSRSSLVLVADNVILRNYGILDTLNANDPVSGFIMQRNYAVVNSLQIFQPTVGAATDHLPFEIFVDVRCESRDFDRLVQQTQATLRYDKFNRLRLRNDLTAVTLAPGVTPDTVLVDHLLHETDLIRIDVPRFSFSADSVAFAAMGDIVTDLLLFSDPAYKARMTHLETMLFSYDFTDFRSAAKVISDLQSRIRRLTSLEETFSFREHFFEEGGQRSMLASKAHIFKLSQELNLIFDAIRLAQEKTDKGNQEKKSALRAEFSSSEISWLILDERRELLAKLAVRGIHFSWLSRKDGSTNSLLSLADLQAFDGSPDALWPEILAKYDEPPTHRMIKRGLFVEAQWSVLAPVGGISIYDHFKVELHPIRLAVETRLGNKLADYFIPARGLHRQASPKASPKTSPKVSPTEESKSGRRHSGPRFTLQQPDDDEGVSVNTPTLQSHQDPPPRPRLAASRSFTNLRSTLADDSSREYHAPGLPKSISSTSLSIRRHSTDSDNDSFLEQTQHNSVLVNRDGDASEMRHRSVQKTFVHVEIPSVHVLLSVMKGRGFLVKEARLRTHDLEWRNRTSSLEELFNQFMPSDPSLRGWVKVAWQQPIFSVGGVVKELITKTQWGRLGKDNDGQETVRPKRIGRKSTVQDSPRPSAPGSLPEETHAFPSSQTDDEQEPQRMSRKRVKSLFDQPRQRSTSRQRVASLFKRSGTKKFADLEEPVPKIPHQ